ncbi:aminotransferase class I and II [Lysobacter sp. Root916]|uniref:HipA family kinase n=1 Tax=Lysobacter sp. Root916 TaxID=1736606 RepID=UPI00070CF0DC|nr:HipA family kinase [Lysobacter sp. Root916]KRD34603.1 aminotransferase class I and II [Lysobacter sp. Root916]
MRTVSATRYVTPLREGGSLPAVVEGDDDGLYVLKFRGAGQGRKALIAELIGGELARALGLPMPEIVLAELDPELARTEPDPEIQHLIRESAGLNLALDYLPGAVNYDPLVDQPDAALASRVVWFDAYLSNVDRTARNTNLLIWHRRLHLIDHGAALYFHHDWDSAQRASAGTFAQVQDHVLLPLARELRAADAELAPQLTPTLIERVVGLLPDAWLGDEPGFADADALRRGYADYLQRRVAERAGFVEEAVRAQSRYL